MVNWQMPLGGVFEDAKSANKPIVLFFVEKDDEATRDAIRGPKLSPLSKEKANFILVLKPIPVEMPAAESKPKGPTITSGGKAEKKAEGEAEKAAEEVSEPVKSPVPVNRLNAGELWAAFGVTAANTVVVTDWYGNEKGRYARVPTESALVKAVENVPALVEADSKALAGDVEKLEKFVAGNEEPKAVKQALKIFKRGLVGHEAIAKTEGHYAKLIESGKAKMQTLEAAGDTNGLRALKGAYRETEIEGEVTKAISRVQAIAGKATTSK